jgi:4-hydroxy-3-methylbut-2-enyl diphosphate reductase
VNERVERVERVERFMRSSVELAGGAGFCRGVRRALEQVEALAARARAGRLVTLGPLIHSAREVERLRGLGVLPVLEAELRPDDEVVLSTHGTGPAALRAVRARVAAVHDTTCAYVRSLQNLARRMAAAGYEVLVVGEREHPEVRAVLGWAAEAARASGAPAPAAASSAAEVRVAPARRKLALLAQTTQSPERLRAVAARCLERGALELRVLDTICPCTRERQAEALALAAAVELMLVVGDRQSANTRRLGEVCRAVQPRTELVQDAAEIDPAWLRGVRRVAVSGGASVSESTLGEVVSLLRDLEHE